MTREQSRAELGRVVLIACSVVVLGCGRVDDPVAVATENMELSGLEVPEPRWDAVASFGFGSLPDDDVGGPCGNSNGHMARRAAIAGSTSEVEVYRLSDGAVARIPPASPAVATGLWDGPIYVSAEEIVLAREIRDPYPQVVDIRFIRLDALEYVPR